jgi:hypothetical protein
MRLPHKRSRLERLVDTVTGSLDGGSSPMRLGMPGGGGPAKALKEALPGGDKALKAGVVAGGLAGLTAGSAGISSLRRRREGARDAS